MAARVDIRQTQVRDGDIVLPFTADCGAGTAVLDPLGQPVHLRTLLWGEKCRLARYAGVDPTFVETQFLSICSEGNQPDAARRPALVALALWLQGPDAIPLPLDAAMLGDVTLGLCRALRISPTELGAIAVPEVEALWLAMGSAETPDNIGVDPLADGVSRIVIEPDPRPDSEETAQPSAAVSTSRDDTTPNGLALQPSSPKPQPSLAPNEQPAEQHAPATAELAAQPSGKEKDAQPTISYAVEHRSFSHRSSRRPGGRSPSPRFRVGVPSSVSTAVRPILLEGDSGPLATTRALLGDVPTASAPAPRSASPASMHARRLRPATPAVETATPPGDNEVAAALAGQIGTLIDIVARAAGQSHDAPPDSGASFEAFGDRLAEAVNELGLTGGE